MLTLLGAHLVVALLAVPMVRRLGRAGIALTALAPASALVWLAWQGWQGRIADPLTQTVPWVPTIDLSLSLRLDPLAAILLILITGVGTLILVYCAGYFDPRAPGTAPTIAYLVAFAGAMIGLVLADDLLLLFVFWEITTVLSYLLIGGRGVSLSARKAAKQALILTTAGGLAMLVGIVLLAHAAGTTRISRILDDPQAPDATVVAAVVLLLVGATTKSAQFPWHFWLPAAMAAPTPVSAYLHAAAMVKAGVYLIARFAPVFADLPQWRAIVIGLGLTTMLLGAYRALRQHDLKLLLAYGTVSQLGFICAVIGSGTRLAALAGATLVLGHGLFKAALFLITGAIDHSTGTRDIRTLSGLHRSHRGLFVGALLAAASMAGLPPLLGFVGKEAALDAMLALGSTGWLLFAIVVLASALTAGYAARFVWGAFADKPGLPASATHPLSPALWAPVALLAALSLALGPGAAVVDALVARYAAAFPADGHDYHLALWHGFTLPLAGSALALGLGAVLFWQRGRVESAQARLHEGLHLRHDASAIYWKTNDGLDWLATRVTALTQRGSLSQYVSVILVVMVLVPGTIAATQGVWPSHWRAYDHPLQPFAVLIVVGGALAALRERRRTSSIVLTGTCGYAVAVMFILHGAPDLALTQFLVETITLIVAVLALRRLPRVVNRRSDFASPGKAGRWVIAVAVGLTLTTLTAVASAGRSATPVSQWLPPQAESFGGGYNVVNVVLVDVRAWDTFGETSVLVAAATGVASLIFLRQQGSNRPRRPSRTRPRQAGAQWLAVQPKAGDPRRSLLLEVVVRLSFHTTLVLSLYLLFAGHNNPGGGFAGGLVAGLAFASRYVAGGRGELDAAAPFDAGRLLGAGLVLAALSGLAGPLFGGQVLQTAIVTMDVPLLGTVKLVTSLFFDIGVYLVVVGLTLDLLRSLGVEIDRQPTKPQPELEGSAP